MHNVYLYKSYFVRFYSNIKPKYVNDVSVIIPSICFEILYLQYYSEISQNCRLHFKCFSVTKVIGNWALSAIEFSFLQTFRADKTRQLTLNADYPLVY